MDDGKAQGGTEAWLETQRFYHGYFQLEKHVRCLRVWKASFFAGERLSKISTKDGIKSHEIALERKGREEAQD